MLPLSSKVRKGSYGILVISSVVYEVEKSYDLVIDSYTSVGMTN